jgi:DNA-binding response OmpR family regulator
MPPKVLVVDDDPQANHLLKLLLELDGFDVVLCPRAEKTLPTVQAEKPDVLLMDVHIGSASGLDVLRDLRQDPSLTALPVVMFSGLNVEYECQKAGANAFLLKPYAQDELTATLKKVMV